MSINAPSSWEKCKIGEVTNIVSGGTPPSKDPTNFDDENGIPWITPADLSGYKRMFIDRGARNLSEKGLAACSAAKIPSGSVLFSSRAPIGYVAIAANEVTTNQGFKSFVLPCEIDSRFVYFYLRYIKPVAESMATGTTFKELSGSAIAHIPFLIAPHPEQKRIADKLDNLLTRVDTCRERLDRIPLVLKRFHQSVLAAATKGQLTEDWRKTGTLTGRNAKTEASINMPELIESRPRGWKRMLVGDLLIDKPRNGYSPRAVEFKTQTRSLSLTATTSGKFNPIYFKYIDETIPEDSHLWLEPGDILIQRANTREYVGVSAVYDGARHEFIYPDLMMKCQSNEKVIVKYLHYLLLSDDTREYFRDNATGTAGNMPKINQQIVISAPVWVAPIEEQKEIIRRVETLFAFADRLEARLSTAKKQAERLTPSLLAKAFRGELVPQDPNDEPASVLLEKIITAKGNHSKQLMKKKKKK